MLITTIRTRTDYQFISLSRIEWNQHSIFQIYLILHYLTFVCLVMSKDIWQVSRLRTQMSFSKQCKVFSKVSKKWLSKWSFSSGWTEWGNISLSRRSIPIELKQRLLENRLLFVQWWDIYIHVKYSINGLRCQYLEII
jgi:hypothetical protein